MAGVVDSSKSDTPVIVFINQCYRNNRSITFHTFGMLVWGWVNVFLGHPGVALELSMAFLGPHFGLRGVLGPSMGLLV